MTEKSRAELEAEIERDMPYKGFGRPTQLLAAALVAQLGQGALYQFLGRVRFRGSAELAVSLMSKLQKSCGADIRRVRWHVSTIASVWQCPRYVRFAPRTDTHRKGRHVSKVPKGERAGSL